VSELKIIYWERIKKREVKRKKMEDLLKNLLCALIVILVVVFVIGGLCRGILVEESVAVRALEIQGYTDIEIVDHAWCFVGLRGCDRNDAAKITATATNPVGRQIEVYVCCGWPFKGSTIRTK
jgi:hypothetical protein